MPELAEVETVRVALKEKLIDRKIVKVEILYENIFENKEKINCLIGSSFKDIRRKGKYLIFVLDKGFLLAHLRMEGKFFILKNNELLNKHMHIKFDLDNDQSLIYQDVRKFGRMHYYDTYEELLKDLNLGPDCNLALIEIDNLYLKLKKSKKPIKTLLLDQSFIAGLGNIYVDEVLYKSHIHPNLISSTLNYEDLKNILINSKIILNKAIEYKGTTIRSYTSELGVTGSYQQFLEVHTKEKDPLGHHIFKLKIGGRTSYYCPICQAIRKSYVIGITGGIATGKSYLSNILKEMGFFVSDADIYAKEAYQDIAILKELKANGFIEEELDFKYIAKLIFNSDKKRELLNNIIHPYVINKIKESISEHNLIFVDIPLLYECNLEYLCDKVIVTYLDNETEISRLCLRDNITKEEALKRIASQMDLEIKKERADYVIDTSGSFNDTKKKFIKILEEIINGI